MSQKAAFLSAKEKKFLPELAGALHDNGYKLVSLGNTAKEIQRAGLPVIESAYFLGDDALEEGRGLPEDMRRRLLAARVALTLEKDHSELEEHGWPAIDMAYINLRPSAPVRVPGTTKRAIWSDSDGELMIRAAVKGKRNILVHPDQVPGHVAFLRGELDDHQAKSQERMESDALSHLREYAAYAANLGHIAMLNSPPE